MYLRHPARHEMHRLVAGRTLNACVFGDAGAPMSGPKAAGAAMPNVTGGHEPAGDFHHGPAMPFGLVAGQVLGRGDDGRGWDDSG